MVDASEALAGRLERPPPRLSFGDRWRERRDRAIVDARDRLSLLTVGRAATVIGSVLLIVAAGFWLLRPPSMPVEASIPRAGTGVVSESTVAAPPSGSQPSGTSGTSGTGGTGGRREVVVQAAGAVARPGVYRVPEGARVDDLVTLAGGVVDGADVSVLPLAQKLSDGQRVYVPRPGEVVAPVADLGGGANLASGPINLNSATVDQLDSLPGVGPATASAIVNYRDKHGPFRSVAGLLEVPGIGDAKLEAMRDQVAV